MFAPALDTSKQQHTLVPWSTIALIGVVFFVSASGRVGNSDAASMLELSRSLLDGKVSVPSSVSHTIGFDGKPYCHMGLFVSLWWIPFVLAGRVAGAMATSMPRELFEEFFVSFSGVLVCTGLLLYMAREWLRNGVSQTRVRLGLWLIALGTLVWPYSKSVFSDPVMMLALFAGYHHWQKSGVSRHAVLAGVWLGIALLTRKQAQSILPLFLVFFCFRPVLGRLLARMTLLCAGLVPLIVLQCVYNQVRWGNPLRERYAGYEKWLMPSSQEWTDRTWQLLFGGDYAGLFNFSPVLLVILLVTALRWFRRDRALLGFVTAIVSSQAIFIAQFPYWEAESGTFGSRFLLWLIPFCALGWIFMPERLDAGVRAALAVSFSIGFVIQVLGVVTDPLAACWRRELYLSKDTWIIRAHVAEVGRLVGLDQRPPPERKPISDVYWNHKAFQRPDLWWCHVAAELWQRAPDSAEPR